MRDQRATEWLHRGGRRLCSQRRRWPKSVAALFPIRIPRRSDVRCGNTYSASRRPSTRHDPTTAWRPPLESEVDGPVFDAAKTGAGGGVSPRARRARRGRLDPGRRRLRAHTRRARPAHGLRLPGDNAHAPDESMSVENFELGMRAVATLWDRWGRVTHLARESEHIPSLSRNAPIQISRSPSEAMRCGGSSNFSRARRGWCAGPGCRRRRSRGSTYRRRSAAARTAGRA